MSSPVRVKDERQWDDGADVVAADNLYIKHEVKDELVLGPERLQPQDIAFALHGGGSRAASPEDCLVVLDSEQCDVDPGSLMLPDFGSDIEILDVPNGKPSYRKKKAEAVSSDEDEVILQEPKIDTVEVSDATDEDDLPLQTLIKKRKRKRVFAMYCEQCMYKTDDESHNYHTSIKICISCSCRDWRFLCDTCDYSTKNRPLLLKHVGKWHKTDDD